MSTPKPQHAFETPWQGAWRRYRSNQLACWGIVFLALLVLFCWVGPYFSPYQPEDMNLDLTSSGPSASHWFGTDGSGRDIATRLMHGGQVSTNVALLATLVAVLIGVAYGMEAGLAGGRVDTLMMRVVDILYSFPLMSFVILLTVVVGRNDKILFIAIGAVEWLTTARIVRGQVLALKKLDFVTAARSYGAKPSAIVWRHLFPNVLGQAIISASLTIPGVLLLEAALSFLGLGIQPPAASLGTLILDGANEMTTSPWMLIFPGGLFSLTLLSLSFVGDGLRDALDPKSR